MPLTQVAIREASEAAAEKFLEIVSTTGSSSAAARAVGVHRNTFYKRAGLDPDFRARWDAAQLQSRRHAAEEVMEKAMVATGRIVEEPMIGRDGLPILDDDLEFVMIRRLVDADSRILAKMVDKLLASEDGPPIVPVQVVNNMPGSDRPGRPRLVFPVVSELDALPNVAESVRHEPEDHE